MNSDNTFKSALRRRTPQIGLWLGLGHASVAEICACAGADWLLIDAEHGLNDIHSIVAQLQAIQGYGGHAVARVPNGHGESGATLIKQFLDVGVQTLMVPMVETPEQAEALVRAMRYPPDGMRGMAISRAGRWGHWAGYARGANAQTALIVQVETVEGLRNLEAITETEGVDGVFIGPGDLAASMGHVGDSGAGAVRSEVRDALERVVRCGKAAGTMSLNEQYADEYLEAGASFVAVGFDATLLLRNATSLVRRFKASPGDRAGASPSPGTAPT